MGHKRSDLNSALFAQLDRLGATGLKGDELEAEVKRTDAIVSVADNIVRNADLQLRAAKLFADHGPAVLQHLPMIGKATE